jgi:hypothetical protein
VALGEQSAAPIERVIFAAPVAEGLVLHPPSALVDAAVGHLDHVEGIRALGRVGRVSVKVLRFGPDGHVVERRLLRSGSKKGAAVR